MSKFRGVTLSCKVCGSGFKVPPSRAEKAEYCSTRCAAVVRGERKRKRATLICENCGKPFETVSCHAERRKYCSAKCKYGAPSWRRDLRGRVSGPDNPNWAGGRTFHSAGYIYIACPAHPFASNGYVFEHRLVMETWLRQNAPASPFLIKLGDNLYLSPEFIVHHRDENKANNAIGNLQCMTPIDHLHHHTNERPDGCDPP